MPQNTTTTKENKPSLIKRLFNAGAHYGFSKSRRHPTSTPYLFGNKQGTDIFDLEKTSVLLAEAKEYLKEMGTQGKQVLFVGTKDEIKDVVRARAEELKMPYVTNRWIGGTLTNFSEIQKRLTRLATLSAEHASGELERKYTKKEHLLLTREMEKLAFNFGGISAMERMPGVIVVVDPRHEAMVVKDAHAMKIPVIAIMSSDCNADHITKPVFVNDAHRASVTLVLNELVASYREGALEYIPPAPAAPREVRTESETRRPARA
jgi:small subunit ribosomal protein S2